MLTEIAGIQVDRVSEWLAGNVASARPPFTFEVIAGGLSNLTFKVTGADGGRFVLRRPPLAAALASAHDMGREHRIISALASSDVPVAPALGLCADLDVNGAPFYVMAFVDGHVIKTADEAVETLTVEQRAAASESLIATLGKIHDVDITAVGLDTLSKHDGYVARQLKRWQTQVHNQSDDDHTRIDVLHDVLASHIPEQSGVSVVHGDYRLDNCMVGDDGNVVAVLDWEICTLGEPLADVGLLMAYWTGPDDELFAWSNSGTQARGFANRGQIAERYAALTGRDVSQVAYFEAFASWKLACILDGVRRRSIAGALGNQVIDNDSFVVRIEQALTRAESLLGQLR
jgi:aminoglycoside phosphotransferase (APT) family kinase protein